MKKSHEVSRPATEKTKQPNEGDPIMLESNRRKFLETGLVSLAGITLAGKSVASDRSSLTSGPAPTEPERSVPTVYFADGWHGGAYGHMPIGAMRDILRFLEQTPDWKVSLEIEPSSWDVLLRRDPQVYEELKRLLSDQSVDARVELVGNSYAQPLAWPFSGEINIRHLTRAREITREHFPFISEETYSVQEPCWTSAMPQILRSMGFARAVLKNSTTTFGYTTGFDADMVEWIGPDGSSLPAVPRYACETGVHPHKLESCLQGFSDDRIADFARKCIEHGIPHPSGMHFQDLGWVARKAVRSAHVRFVTWREYCETIAAKPAKPWRFTQEDIRVTLPWGEKELVRLARAVRSVENKLLVAEKMASMANVLRGLPFPAEQLRQAWDNVLLAQHHDTWVCVNLRYWTGTPQGHGLWTWASRASSWALEAEDICDQIIAGCADALADGAGATVGKPLGAQWARVFNTVGTSRADIVELPIATDPGTQSVRVIDGQEKEVVAQIVPVRSYQDDKSLNAATVLFRARTPAVGYSTYRVEPVYERTSAIGADVRELSPGRGMRGAVYETTRAVEVDGAHASTEPNGSIAIETDLYQIRLDPARGGAVTSLFSKDRNKEFCDPASERLFNEYRGYFISEEQWASSAEKSAKVEITENGPVRVRVRVAGEILGRPYRSTMTVVQGQRRIDFLVSFDFGKETWIGDPFRSRGGHAGTQRRSHHNSYYKLQAFFPVSVRNQTLYKNAAYDVCRSENEDTFYTRWDSIKHNIIVNWLDVIDDREQHGLALLSDHTGSYAHGKDYPLSLVLAWGSVGTYSGDCPLSGQHEAAYAVIPHGGNWEQAELSQEAAHWNEPLLAQIMKGKPKAGDETHSLVTVSGDGFETPTLLVEGKDLLVRLFNAAGDDSPRTVSLAMKPVRVELVELDGRTIKELPIERTAEGRYAVRLAMPRFGIRTLRCCGVGTTVTTNLKGS